jgi:hypothetical protein
MLIAIAIAVFVVLVSAQVFRDWPIAALGDGGGESVEVSKAQPVGTTSAGAGAGSSDGGAGSAAGAAANDGRRAGAAVRENGGSLAAGGGVGGTGGQEGTEPGGSGTGDGRRGGSPANGSPQTTNASSPSGSSGSSSSGGGGKSSSDTTTSSPSSQVTDTVHDTVTKVDETALGGSLGNSGVTEATEGVVNGVAGPESAVGKVVDEAVGAVGGLLDGKP